MDELQTLNSGGFKVKEGGIAVIESGVDNRETVETILKSSIDWM